MSKANPRIGTVPCPTKNCDQVCAVKKFAQRAVTEQGRRQGGKLYADCPTHGRFGFDGKAAMQDYILENMKWDNANDKTANQAAVEQTAPTKGPQSAKPAATPASAPAKKQSWAGFLG